jgi:hypothetical protein
MARCVTLAGALEAAVFAQHPFADDASGSTAYGQQMRAIVSHLRDRANEEFRGKILDGSLRPFAVARMEAKDMQDAAAKARKRAQAAAAARSRDIDEAIANARRITGSVGPPDGPRSSASVDAQHDKDSEARARPDAAAESAVRRADVGSSSFSSALTSLQALESVSTAATSSNASGAPPVTSNASGRAGGGSLLTAAGSDGAGRAGSEGIIGSDEPGSFLLVSRLELRDRTKFTLYGCAAMQLAGDDVLGSLPRLDDTYEPATWITLPPHQLKVNGRLRLEKLVKFLRDLAKTGSRSRAVGAFVASFGEATPVNAVMFPMGQPEEVAHRGVGAGMFCRTALDLAAEGRAIVCEFAEGSLYLVPPLVEVKATKHAHSVSQLKSLGLPPNVMLGIVVGKHDALKGRGTGGRPAALGKRKRLGHQGGGAAKRRPHG